MSGKFNSKIDEYLYSVTLISGQDDEIGSVDEIGWDGKIDTKTSKIIPSKEDIKEFHLSSKDIKFLNTINAGCIIEEDSNGFVSVDFFDDIDILDDEWNEIIKMYDEFYEGMKTEEILEDQDDEAAWNDPHYFRKP